MTKFRKTSINCPCCGKKYFAEIMYSTIWSGKVSTDMLRFSMGKMPVDYLVHTCPACGWSGQEEHHQPVSESVREFIKEQITPRLTGEPLSPCRRWEFFSLIQEASGADDLELGGAYLIAAQCARLDEQFDQEQKYRRLSIDHYLRALEEGKVPEDSLYQTTYLVGELYRRVGDSWKSKEWFQKVLNMDLEHERGIFFQDLARGQMREPRNIIGEEPEEVTRENKPSTPLSRLAACLGLRKRRY